ncbi:multidrug resistance protein A [Trypanosoma equiperdum]|uniref:Multidrug resistance protein A n=1 Tax=Trypanosoma equiperdum TaxID=5694 RepID=A0A1G4I8H3_TRYEQ|nr:multidrug resistance protein A [Trypanosoma equiperdum]
MTPNKTPVGDIKLDDNTETNYPINTSGGEPTENHADTDLDTQYKIHEYDTRHAELKQRLMQIWGDDVEYVARGEENANWLQKITYTWVKKYIRTAVKEELTLEGLPTAQSDHRAHKCGRQLSAVTAESYYRRHLWDPIVGAGVSRRGDSQSRGTLRWVGVLQSGRYKEVMAAVTWQTPPLQRLSEHENGVSPFFSGAVHGEVLFPPEASNNSTMEKPEDLQLLGCGSVSANVVDQLAFPGRISAARNLFNAKRGIILWQFPLRVLGDLLTLTVPLILKEYVRYLDAPSHTWGRGMLLAFGLFVAHCVQSVVLHWFYHMGIKGGLCWRSALSAVILEKCFVISPKALALPEMNTGRILNMLTTDVERANEFVQLCLYLWSSPVIFIASTFLLYSLVGWSALVTVVVLPLTLTLNGYIVRQAMKIQRKIMKVADSRVKATNEFISGIRIVKFMAWEPSFIAAIEKQRDTELRYLRRLQRCHTLTSFLNNAMPPLTIAIVFVTYHLLGNKLTPEVVFPTLMLLSVIRMPFLLLPMTLRTVTQFVISMKRVSVFLECENTVKGVGDVTELLATQKNAPPCWCEAAAVFDNAEVTALFPVKLPRIPTVVTSLCGRIMARLCCCGACQPKRHSLSPLEVIDSEDEGEGSAQAGNEKPPGRPGGNQKQPSPEETPRGVNKKVGEARYQLRPKKLLRDISIEVPKGKLTVVLGATGSGKSTLLETLLGNFEVTHGSVLAAKSFAYVPQQPWIMNATLRDNILFFTPENEERLHKAVRVCQLEADLQQLPAGMETEIGEKGINLSGGQKARVSLARAVYADRDFYILDDPLSALDAHVGELIVRDLILGHLACKTRVLATHQLHVLPHADFVVAMEDGTVKFAGESKDFMRSPLCKKLAAEGCERKHEGSSDREVDESDILDGKPVHSNGNEPTQDGGNEGGEKKNTEAVDGRLTLMEEKAVGSVPWKTYKRYVGACGGGCKALLVIFTYFFTELLTVAANLWLSMWSTNKFKLDETTNLYVYLGIVIAGTISVPLRYTTTFGSMRHGSRTLHRFLLRSISTGKMSFFDTTPLGRIVNRFSRDIDRLDNSLPMTFIFLMQVTFSIISAIAVYIGSQPYVLVALIPVCYVYYRLTLFYSASNREIRRVGSTAKAPLMSLVGEALVGSSTISAYGCQTAIMKKALEYIDLVYASSLLENAANRWIGLRVEFLNTVVILVIALTGVIGAMLGVDSHDIALVSLSLTMALMTTAALNWLVRMCGSMEADMNSVERILYYTDNIENEDMPELDELVRAAKKAEETTPRPKASSATTTAVHVPVNGPVERNVVPGWVEFRDVDLRYRDGLPLVLNKVSFRVNPGQKVGIVGRTGSGKSTLLLTFMRMVDTCGGEIIVSGRPIASYGLRELRQLFSMIPQDPVLFDGTVASNLDPFSQATPEEVWRALELVGMRGHVAAESGGIEARVQEGGLNYSVGQRQLLCLARALLKRDSAFILMDEATANIDHALDKQIQNTVRTAFANHTVITIAHRLHTVAQYDKIIVMDNGVVAECGAPRDLALSTSSKFRELLNSLGTNEVKNFMAVVEGAAASRSSG